MTASGLRVVCAATLLAAIGVAVGCYPKNWPRGDKLYLEQLSAFDVGPYLVRLGPSAAAVVLRHDLDRPPVVEFTQGSTVGDASGVERVTATKLDGVWVAATERLPVNGRAVYTVKSSVGTSGPSSFRTGRRRGEPFRFAAFGDTRTGHKVHRALIESMAREDIDFVVHSGDLVEFGGRQDQWDLFFQIEHPVISRVFLFAAVGNHDESRRGHFRRHFLSRLVNEGDRFHHQDWGDVRVVVMDSEIDSRSGSRQYRWLEGVLSEGADNDQLMVVALHYPPYSSGSHGSYVEIQKTLSELLPRYGVELVLAGHDHNYERTIPMDGVTYMVAASGGANIRAITPSSFSAALRTEPHYVLFDVIKGGLQGRAVNLQGNVFDSFVIAPNPARESKR